MFQIRMHGRDGQGVVSAAEMLSDAAFLEGDCAQAFPGFGSERMGAPVVAFRRVDDKEIGLREPVMAPDALIVQDPTLLHQVDLFGGLDTRGYLLVNTRRRYRDLGLGDYVTRFPPHHIRTVAATQWANPDPEFHATLLVSIVRRKRMRSSAKNRFRQPGDNRQGWNTSVVPGRRSEVRS